MFDNGPKVEVLEYFDGRELCDGDWHSLLVSKDGLAGLISVDGRTPQRKISSCGICQNFLATNTKDSLYVGGIPGMSCFCCCCCCCFYQGKAG